MAEERKRLGEMLIERGVLSPEQVETGLRIQRQWGVRLGTALCRKGFLTEEVLVRFLSLQLGIPAVDLAQVSVPAEVQAKIPRELQERFQAIPIAVHQRGDDPNAVELVVALSDPLNLESVQQLSFATGMKISPVIAGETQIHQFLFPESEALELEGGDEDMVIMRGSSEVSVPTGGSTAAPPLQTMNEPVLDLGNAGVAEMPPTVNAVAQMMQEDPRALVTALVSVLVEKGFLTAEELVARFGSGKQ